MWKEDTDHLAYVCFASCQKMNGVVPRPAAAKVRAALRSPPSPIAALEHLSARTLRLAQVGNQQPSLSHPTAHEQLKIRRRRPCGLVESDLQLRSALHRVPRVVRYFSRALRSLPIQSGQEPRRAIPIFQMSRAVTNLILLEECRRKYVMKTQAKWIASGLGTKGSLVKPFLTLTVAIHLVTQLHRTVESVSFEGKSLSYLVSAYWGLLHLLCAVIQIKSPARRLRIDEKRQRGLIEAWVPCHGAVLRQLLHEKANLSSAEALAVASAVHRITQISLVGRSSVRLLLASSVDESTDSIGDNVFRFVYDECFPRIVQQATALSPADAAHAVTLLQGTGYIGSLKTIDAAKVIEAFVPSMLPTVRSGKYATLLSESRGSSTNAIMKLKTIDGIDEHNAAKFDALTTGELAELYCVVAPFASRVSGGKNLLKFVADVLLSPKHQPLEVHIASKLLRSATLPSVTQLDEHLISTLLKELSKTLDRQSHSPLHTENPIAKLTGELILDVLEALCELKFRGAFGGSVSRSVRDSSVKSNAMRAIRPESLAKACKDILLDPDPFCRWDALTRKQQRAAAECLRRLRS